VNAAPLIGQTSASPPKNTECNSWLCKEYCSSEREWRNVHHVCRKESSHSQITATPNPRPAKHCTEKSISTYWLNPWVLGNILRLHGSLHTPLSTHPSSPILRLLVWDFHWSLISGIVYVLFWNSILILQKEQGNPNPLHTKHCEI